MSADAGLLAGYIADVVLGDPPRWHPVAGLGRTAAAVERVIYAPTRTRGVLHTAGLVTLSALAAEVAARRCGRTPVLALVTWAALGGRSLTRVAQTIAECLERGDLEGARAELPTLVGRDPAALDEADICRAVIESVAENTGDAVVGVLLWGALAGPAGVVAYRAANTLDAMVGHRTERYERFGWAAARLDDLLGWPSARVAAALAALCAPVVGGSPRQAWRTLRRDGAAHPSPNAGRLEAAFAGALGVRLGGTLAYSGRVEHRPLIGEGPAPTPRDVRRAAHLSRAVAALSAFGLAAARRAHSLDGAR